MIGPTSGSVSIDFAVTRLGASEGDEVLRRYFFFCFFAARFSFRFF